MTDSVAGRTASEAPASAELPSKAIRQEKSLRFKFIL